MTDLSTLKKAGLVGGMGPQSLMPYYLGITYGVRELTRPDFFPNLAIESINVFEVLDFCAREDYDGLTEHVLRALQCLAAAGAQFAALTANTTHIIFDRLQARSPIPLISIVEATAAEAARLGYRRVGLLGTIFTMTHDFYFAPFERLGINVVVPDVGDMLLVNRRITDELELGIVRLETLEEFQRVIRDMEYKGAQAVILGCTELPLLLNDGNSPLPVLDTVQIHVQAIIRAILG